MPTIETERLILRPLTVADAQHIYASWTSDPDVERFMVWELHGSVADTVEWLAGVEEGLESDTSYTWGVVLRETGLLIGSAGIGFVPAHGCFELGYNFMKSAWGKGYATETGRGILKFAKETLGQRRFFCRHAVENVRSQRVIEKLGFKYVGDGAYDSMTGKKHFISRDYFLE
ncbi:MAG TPA: GNAT family N-acetyltransferase [Candidatus Acidoferrum sp.]|nr:GNAT family N-acetyltransferase [Candidatus Acidoferrum sp.]